jgi:uncharacterized delta-60 repeat protein
MKNRFIIISLLVLSLMLSLTGCSDSMGDDDDNDTIPGDDFDPVITSFTVTSNNPTAYEVVSLNVQGNSSVTSWLVNENPAVPSANDPGWSSTKPVQYTLLSGYGAYTLYAWAKNSAGNISDLTAGTQNNIEYVAPGSEVWSKQFDGNGSGDNLNGIAIDSNNNVYVAGYGTDLVSASSLEDIWIKKFTSDGTEITTGWNKKINNRFSSIEKIDAIAVDSSDNVYVSGYGSFLVSGSSGGDIWIKKFRSDGTEITTGWNKKIDGNGGSDRFYGIAFDSNDNVYVAGFGDNLISGTSQRDLWIKKFRSDGTEITSGWDKRIDGNSSHDSLNAVAVDSNGNIYVGGYGYNLISGSSDADFWIKKFTGDGTEITSGWDKRIDGNSGYDTINAIAIDSNDNVYAGGYGYNLISGSSDPDLWIKKYLSDGTEVTAGWDKQIDGNDENDSIKGMVIDDKNNLYIAGAGEELIPGSTRSDLWIKKFMSDGTEITDGWDKRINVINDSADFLSAIAIDSNKSIYVVGSYWDSSGSTGYDILIKKFFDDRP